MKEAVCLMDHRDCQRCLVAERCIYPYLFETPVPSDVPQLRGQQHAPHPFILTSALPPERKRAPAASPALAAAQRLPDGREIKVVRAPAGSREAESGQRIAPGGEVEFGLLLMGRAVEYLPYVVYAVSEMGRRGLGFERSRFELSEVMLVEEGGAMRTIYSNDVKRIIVPPGATKKLGELIDARLDALMGKRETGSIKLKFLTPARIRIEGDLQPGMSFQLLARNLLRRVSMLTAVHGGAQLELDYRGLIERAADVETRDARLRWWDWERYSNRQQTKMHMGGFVGDIEYSGEAVEEFLPLVAAGEILHVGSGTGFGLGRYEIVD
ncbi:MAG TPA: CRISPR system precrRNA processing endoribonuclease RAMP protein Cas6 [Blastocatellia bacterium]|nr:CRISPR system precrRNA processing endoribonuclease RAMP protein Cas6 [Blastocatellia bacterium]